MATSEVEDLLTQDQYGEIVDRMEHVRGADVFAQDLRDAFAKNGAIPRADYLIAELFQDTLIFTNYDRLIEQCSTSAAERRSRC